MCTQLPQGPCSQGVLSECQVCGDGITAIVIRPPALSVELGTGLVEQWALVSARNHQGTCGKVQLPLSLIGQCQPWPQARKISLVFCCPVSWKKMLSRESVGHRELGPSTGLSGQSPAVPAWTAALSGPVSNSRAGETSAGSTTVPRPHTLEAGPGSHLFLDRGQLLQPQDIREPDALMI